MDVSPVPSLNASDIINYADNAGSGASAYAAQNGLIYNPYNNSFEANPLLQTSSGYQTALAQAQNAGTNATLLTTDQLQNYRLPDGSVPKYGTTFGQLQGLNATAVTPSQAQSSNTVSTTAALVQQAHTLYNSANPNQGDGALNALIGKLGIGSGAKYNAIKQQLASLGIAVPDLGTNPSVGATAFPAILNMLGSQAASLSGQSTTAALQGATQNGGTVPTPSYETPQASNPAIGAYTLGNIANNTNTTVQDPYTSSQAGIPNPNQMGADAYQATLGGQ